MEPLKLPTAYPGNRYSQTVTVAGVVDPASIIVRLYYRQGGRPHLTQPGFTVNKTPGRGTGSQDVCFTFEDTLKLPVQSYLEIWADNKIIRAGVLNVSR